MLNRMNNQWPSHTIKKKLENGELTFDIDIQRNHVWDCEHDSLLMQSMMTGFPIPPIFLTRDKETKQYKGIDGQQRSLATSRFLRDEYALHTATPDVEIEEGKFFAVAGLTYSELPEDLQNAIRDFSFTIYYYEDITDDQIQDMFDRLNNGVAFTPIERLRAKTKDIKVFQEIAKHDAISGSVTVAGRRGFKHELLAMQMYALVNMETPTFLMKSLAPFIAPAKVGIENQRQICDALDYVSHMFTKLGEDKANKDILSKMKKPTNLTALFYMSYKAQERSGDEWISCEAFMDKAVAFFTTEDGATTVSEEYNEAVRVGSAKPEQVNTRMEEVETALDISADNTGTDGEE